MNTNHAPRLNAPPLRSSPGFGVSAGKSYDGLVKLRLGHAAFGSILLPEFLFVKLGGWHFYQPIFFGPPVLGFGLEPALNVARFNVDVGGPRKQNPTRLHVEFRSDQIVRGYNDGAQLYRCRIEGPSNLLSYAAGRCWPKADRDFDVLLSHITNPAAFASIRSSGQLRSSRWNLRGTRALANVAYVYLTSLTSISSEGDLRRIAMSSDGVIRFQTTSSRPREVILDLTVYRESTTGRTARLPVRVETDILAPPHLLIHRPFGDQAYYEVVGPEIYRVGLQPGEALMYGHTATTADAGALRRFEYLVVGDASTLEGLSAPYDEEETKQVVHLQKLGAGIDLFDFWQANANSDQVTDRQPEIRMLSPPS